MSQSQTIQFKRLAVEGAAIVASILLAFGIDAAWEDRQELRQERLNLASLLADFEDTRDRINVNLGRHDGFRKSAMKLVEVAQTRAAGIEVSTIEEQLLDVFFNGITLNTSNGSLDSLLASGGLATIRNAQLRALLASWPSRFADVAEDELWVLTDVQERAIPYLNSVVLTRNILARDPWHEGFITAAGAVDYSVLWDDRLFMNIVLYRIASEATAIGEMTGLLADAENIIGLIESELAR